MHSDHFYYDYSGSSASNNHFGWTAQGDVTASQDYGSYSLSGLGILMGRKTALPLRSGKAASYLNASKRIAQGAARLRRRIS